LTDQGKEQDQGASSEQPPEGETLNGLPVIDMTRGNQIITISLAYSPGQQQPRISFDFSAGVTPELGMSACEAVRTEFLMMTPGMKARMKQMAAQQAAAAGDEQPEQGDQ